MGQADFWITFGLYFLGWLLGYISGRFDEATKLAKQKSVATIDNVRNLNRP